jgi:acetyl-CoA synthetase
MRDYFETVKNFSAADLGRRVLAGSLADGVNACVECCDRWAKDGAIALEWYGANGQRRTLTFAELHDNAAKFAHYLQSHGIGRGDVVAGLLPRIPDLFTVILGAWHVGAMYQPLFTAFGPAAIESRVTAAGGSKAKLVVTDVSNRPKLKDVPDCPDILTVGDGFAEAIASQSTDFAPVMLKGSDPFVVLFTSGTTGKPKGVRPALPDFRARLFEIRDIVGHEVFHIFPIKFARRRVQAFARGILSHRLKSVQYARWGYSMADDPSKIYSNTLVTKAA